jgi:hypothetical protein
VSRRSKPAKLLDKQQLIELWTSRIIKVQKLNSWHVSTYDSSFVVEVQMGKELAKKNIQYSRGNSKL